MLVTGLATVGCFIPAVGWAACAGLQAVAYGVRTEQTINSDGGWQKNKNKILLDGVVTAGTAGLGGAYRLARYGTLAGIKGAPLVGIGKAMKPFQTEAWNNMGMWSWAPQVATWTGPTILAKEVQGRQAG
jgi:hypothetical protein